MRYRSALFTLSIITLPITSDASDPLQLNPESPWYALDSEPGWQFELGLGVEIEPTYAGSDSSESAAGVSARALFRTQSGHRIYFGLGEIGTIYSISENTQFQGFIEYEEGRDRGDDPILDTLDSVESTIEGQFTLARRFGDSSIFATLQPDLTGDANKGLVWFVGASHDWLMDNDKWRFGTRLDISGADSEYMQTEFGITSDESLRSGFRTFQPNSGLKSLTLGLSTEYYLSNRMSILGSMEVESYLGDAADSPLILDLGSKTGIEANLLFRWRL
ncbi:MipA/OmpV family protein [Arenicella sp. 4NH20-0111]|uniref:MipA/OmpV family protein n=1 Tax=Arenicella sp. 4NH20-0111 TaxID=3127648 RepID=UPI00310358E5